MDFFMFNHYTSIQLQVRRHEVTYCSAILDPSKPVKKEFARKMFQAKFVTFSLGNHVTIVPSLKKIVVAVLEEIANAIRLADVQNLNVRRLMA